LVDRLDAARARLTPPERDDAKALALMDGDVRARWAGLDLTQRRAVARALVDEVVVHPPRVRGSNAFDLRRLDILWRA
jgi:hypothetical protein